MSIVRSVLLAGTVLTLPLVASATRAQELFGSQHMGHGTAPTSSSLVRQVHDATQGFWDVRQAVAAKYQQFLGCVSGPQEGAMGVHFVNSDLVGDGELDVKHPEALIYEVKNNVYRLVGVEFIVMADAWNSKHNQPPVLEGQVFQYNGSPNRYGLPAFYELHVWAWRDNPHGAFVDWNTRVTCEDGR